MRRIMMVVGVMAFSGSVFAGESAKAGGKPVEMTKEQRTQMADAHERMAQCLRSARSLPECHDEMMKSCQQTMGHGMCPMMGKGLAHGGPRGDRPSTKTE